MDVAKASSRLASFSSDEETEDDGEPTMAQDGAPTAGNGAAATDSAGQPLIEELLIEKKRAAKRKFTEDMLIGPCGLDRMYETFPNKCRMRGRGYEAADLSRLMCLYNEWAYQLFPGMHRDDLLDAVCKMGSKPSIKTHMNRLRDKERNRYIVDVLKMDAPAAEMTSPNGATSPEDNDTPHVYSEMRTPTQPTVSVDMPDFDEACMLALDAAMARHKEPTAGDVAAGEDMTFGTVTSSATHVVEDAVLTSSIVNSKNDLMVNLSDEEELELDFEEFDSL